MKTTTYKCGACGESHEVTYDPSDISASVGHPGSWETPPEPAEIIYEGKIELEADLSPKCREWADTHEDTDIATAIEEAWEEDQNDSYPDYDDYDPEC